MGKITDEILKAVEIIVDKKLKSLPFDRTAEGKIIRKTKTGYLVSVEGRNLDIPYPESGSFQENDTVKVHIPQNNRRNAYLTGTQADSGSTLLEAGYNGIRPWEYSSEEKAIGIWNGKTLYRRTVTVTSPVSIAATSWYTIRKIAPGLNVLNLYGTFHEANAIYPFCYGSYHIRYLKNTGEITFYNTGSGAYAPTGFRVVIEYTY